ncbi:MAG: hypothetical protein ACI9P7_001031, partial [Candidatus Azotimanducaceae bacterium]
HSKKYHLTPVMKTLVFFERFSRKIPALLPQNIGGDSVNSED